MTDEFEYEEDETPNPFGEEEITALLEAPVDVILCNHLYHILQLATVHLGAEPPRLAEAQLLIDAAGAVIDTTGTRLGQPAEIIREALTQIRLAFVRASGAQPASE